MAQSQTTVTNDKTVITVEYDGTGDVFHVINSHGPLFEVRDADNQYLGTITMTDMLEYIGYY